MKKYLSFGGGVNSVALYLYLIERGEDFEAVFVHHGTDWPETYDYVAGFQWWLKRQGLPLITVLRPDNQGFSTLYDFCWNRFSIPSMMHRWCTDKFKVRVLHKYYQKPAVECIGIDYGEMGRAKISTKDGFESRWPLIEAEIDRNGCKEIIRKWGLPVPQKSGCYICPFQKQQQWIELRYRHPCLFQKAVELERRCLSDRWLNNKKPMYFVHNMQCTLLSVVEENQKKIFKRDEYPPCQCGL